MSLITQATEAVKRLQEKLSLRRDYIDTFSTSHGRRVLADIMSRAGVTTPRFNADPELARFLEGHRHLAFSIFRQVHGSMNQLPGLMVEEMKKLDHNQENQTQE